MSNRLTKGISLSGRVISRGGIAFATAGVIDGAGAPTNGGAGTGVGFAGKGSLYLDNNNGVMYINTGTKASPTWTLYPVGAAAADGLGQLGVARATFDAGIAGNRTIAAHPLAATIPINSFVVGGFIHVNTLFTSNGGNAGTIAISVEGANDIQTAAACSGAPWSTTGAKAIVPKANTPESTSILTTAARAVTATVAGQTLLTGKATIFLYYVVSQ